MGNDQQALKSVVKGAAISTTGVFVSQYFLSPLIGILNTRILGVETYGLFALASSVIGIFGMFPLLGLHEGLIKFVPVYLYQKQIEKIKGALRFSIRVTTVLGFLCFGVCVLLTDYLSVSFFKKPEMAFILYLASITIVLNTYQYLFAGFFAALKDIKVRTLIKYIYPNVSKLIILFFVFILGGGVLGVMIAVLAASWIQVMAGWVHARKLFPPLKNSSVHPVFRKDDKKQFLQYSTPLYLVMFVDLVLQQTDGIMIGYFRSAAEVGIYEVSFRFTPFLLLALGSTAQMFQPFISDYFARNEIQKVAVLYKQVTKIVLIITLPILLILLVFPSELLSIFGVEFSKGATCLMILSAGFFFQALAGHTNPILALSGHPRLLFYSNSVMTVMNIVLNFFFIQWWGIVGAAVATSVSIIFTSLGQLCLIYGTFKIHPYSWSSLKPLFAAIISGVIVYYLYIYLNNLGVPVWFNFILATFLLVLYSAALFGAKLSADEKMLLNEFKNKFYKKIGIR